MTDGNGSSGAIRALRAGVGALDAGRYTFSDGLLGPGGLWLSGQTASEYDEAAGKVTVRGDARQQSGTIYRKIGGVLTGAGMTLADLSHVTQYVPVQSLGQLPAINGARAELVPSDCLTVSTCLVDGLLRRGAQLEVEGEAPRVGAGSDDLPRALATVLPVDRGGEVAYPGDAASQLRWCVDRAAAAAGQRDRVLAAAVVTYRADSSPPRVPASGPVAGAVSYRATSGLAHPDVLVSVDAVCAPAGSVSSRAIGGPAGAAAAAVQVGPILLVHGLSCAGDEALASAGVAEQASAIYSALTEYLAGSGTDSTVLRTVESVVTGAVGQYRAVSDVRREFLRPPWPAASGLIYADLPGAGVKLQVDAVALVASRPPGRGAS
jgi:enamine deaminase RidA (YjgF/YER057c/UK114 family)